MSAPMLYLLDKNVVRRSVEGLAGLADRRILTSEEVLALQFLEMAGRLGHRLFIAPASHNILTIRFASRPETRVFLQQVEVLHPTRYCRRWARRLRTFGFTREDAWELALGTFSTDQAEKVLGVHVIVTFDRPMVSLFTSERAAIQERLVAMTARLASPWCTAALPDVKLLLTKSWNSDAWRMC